MKTIATLPPCSLVLHSPWMNGPNDEYIGVVTDAQLIQCTYAAELNEDVPVITDRFLSFTNDPKAFWIKRAPNTVDPSLSTEYEPEHVHDLSHSHSAYGLASQARYSSKIDRNNSGTADDHVAPLHSHDITLDEERFSAHEENGRNSYEPHHYEVSAYYVDPEAAEDAVVPAGMIVVSHTLFPEVENDGWIRLDQKTLRRDPRETDPGYQPRHWWTETIKVVGCIPSKFRKGSVDHSHAIEPHRHPSGIATGGYETVALDDSTGRARYAKPGHEHPITNISVSYDQLQRALNLRRHHTMFIYMAHTRGARMLEGMLVPFIPRNEGDVARATASGDWSIRLDDSAKDRDPLMITSVHPEDISDQYDRDPQRDRLRQIKGRNEHTHDFPHSHEFTPAASTSDSFFHSGGDDESDAAEKTHAHDSMRLYETVESGPSINPLKYRRCMFLESRRDQN